MCLASGTVSKAQTVKTAFVSSPSTPITRARVKFSANSHACGEVLLTRRSQQLFSEVSDGVIRQKRGQIASFFKIKGLVPANYAQPR